MKYILALLLLLSGLAFAQSHPKADTPIAQAKPMSPTADSTRMSQLDYYKKMYELSAESAAKSDELSRHVVNLIFQTIGAIITVFLALQGLYYYSLNVNKLKAIESNLKSIIDDKISTLEKELRSNNKTDINGITNNLNRLYGDVRETIRLHSADITSLKHASFGYGWPTNTIAKYLEVAEKANVEDDIFSEALTGVYEVLLKNGEIDLDTCERIEKLLPKLKPINYTIFTYITLHLNSNNVYRKIPKEGGGFDKEYLNQRHI